MPDRSRETELGRLCGGPVAGVDEVGRGPLAGPVVAAAVILPPDLELPGLDDSKRLGARRRTELAQEIHERATVSIALASVAEIDRLNILQATLLAMRRAIAGLRPVPAGVLIDGNRLPEGLALPARAVVGGDGLETVIAAASIVAKVHRDRLMADLDTQYPGYGLGQHAGYGTAAHLDALRRLGPSPVHRRSFRPVRDMIA